MNEAKKKIVIGISVVAVLLAAVIALLLGGKKTTDVSNETTSDLYKITILESAHGSVTANKYEAKEGEEIVLTVTPDENYELSSLAVNQKESETTFKMPAEDVRVLAKFALIEGAETAAYEGDTFGSAEGYVTTEGVDLSDDNGENPYISVTAGGPQYAYVKNVYTDQLVFETTFKVNEIFNEDVYPKFGIMLNGATEMVKFFVDLKNDLTCESVGVVHQPTGGEDDWANAYSKSIEKLNLADQEITLKVVRDRQDYYFYVNNVMVLCEKGALCSENTAVGIFSFNTGLEAFEYRHLEDDMAKAEIAQAKSDSYPMMGDFFGKSGRFYSSDVIDFSTDHGEMPYLVLDAYKGTPLYTYINNFSSKQYYFEIDATVTAIRDDEEFPKFGIITRNEKEMVKFYFDMSREKLVPQIGIVRQLEGGKDDWDNQDIALLPKTLNLGEEKVEIGVLRNGTAYYVYVNDELIINGNDLSSQEEAAGFFTFGTSLIINNYKLIESGEQFDALLQKARKDTKGLYDFRLSQNYFDEKENGVYVLKTDSADESKVDDVMYYSQIFRESYYSVSGKITLSNAENWGQSRILISSDPQNEHVIALEKTGKDTYQIFAMSKDGEKTWNDWRLILSSGLNGDRNSLDFEVIVARDKVCFLIDDEICYTSDRVSMEESTVKFSGYKKATTTVENLDGKRFKNGEELNEYLKTKDYADYETEREARINELYKEYFVTNNCADKGGTLLFGNSHIDFWEGWEAQSGLTNYVNGYNVGIDLSTTSDWLYAYDKLVKPFGAERYVICIGENDATNWGLSGSEIVSNLKTLFEKIHKDFPNAEIYYIYQFPSPANYAKGKLTNEKLAELAKAEKQLCNSLSYVTGMDAFDLLVTKDKKSSNKNLFRDTDKLHLNEAGYQVWSDYLYDEIFKGETFGVTKGDGVTYKTTNGIELINDKGNASTVEIFGKAPRYAYVNDTYTEKVYFETEVSLTELLTDEYPKFGLMVNGKTEMVKFYLDVNKDTKEVTQIGVLKQPTGGEDDWANQKTAALDNKVTLATDKVKLALLRDGKDYYFYVDGELVATGSDLKAENGAVGVFSFNSVVTLDNYKVVKAGDEYNGLLKKAIDDLKSREGFKVKEPFAEIREDVFQLTNSNAVSDLTFKGEAFTKEFYSVKGKLTLSNAGDWGQSRILISKDSDNEHMIALEKTDQDKYQIFAVSRVNGKDWDWNNRTWICDGIAKTYGNSINFEAVVDGSKVYFLIDDVFCYASDRVEMGESTVKFAGYNTATTTVENIEGTTFADSQEVQNHLAKKSGENFGKTEGDGATYQTAGADLSKDYGKNPSIRMSNAENYNAYLKDTFADKFYFKTEFNVSSVKDGENYPKFGIQLHSEEEQVRFYVDMSTSLTSNTVGVVHNDDWTNRNVTATVAGMSFTGNEKVKLEVIRDGNAYFFYVNDKLTLYDGNGLTDAKSAVGIFTFGTELTASSYQILTGDAAKEKIAEAIQSVNFFDSATVDLSKDYGAKIGTVNVNTGNTEFIYVKNYFEKDFYFETKVHVNEIYHSENWPKFGVFAENENCSTREIFYVDMATDKTSSIVGRKTNDWNNNWSDSTSATVAEMNFAGDGEYVTLGLQKVDGYFFFYVNGEYVLKFGSAITDKAKIGVFGFNTGMELKEYFVSEAKTVGKMIASNNEAGIDIVEIGKKIWTNKDYVFTSLPEAFIGKEFVKASYGESGKTVDVTVQKPGYIYVLTNAYKMNNSQAETLDDLNYTKLDMANWKFCSFTTTTSYIWVYEKYVEAGEKLQLGQWSVVIASEERLNLDSDTYKVSDANMAVLKPGTSATVGNMELGVIAFADKPYKFSDMPYWLAGKNYILGSYGKGSATATCGGVVYMLTNTGNSGSRVQYFENKGYIQVNVPKFTAFTGGNFDTYDFVVYKKTVAEDEEVTWPSWAIPIFSGDLVLSDNLAKIKADGTTTQEAQYEQNVRLFDNRTYYASGDKLEALHGKSYLLSGFEEGATGTVTKAGTVYVQIPTKTTNSTYVQLEADLIADGYTPAPYRLYRNNKGVPGKNLGYAQKLYQKEVAVGDIIHFGQYNLVYFDTLNTEEYYEMPSVTTAAKIYNNPKTTGIQNALYTYDPDDRNWQGCPVVTITDGPNGKRMWAAWFTGGATELNTGNFAVLLYSDDNGKTWVDPAVAIVHPDTAAQVTKPQLWTLDDGRLWVSWSQHTGTGGFDGKMGTWAAICENPGASIDQLNWSEPKRLFDGRGNGKVTVLNKGQANEEWLTTAFDWIDRNYSKVYSSMDKGGTWTFKGKAEVTGSTYNNAILTELKDGTLWMLLRQLEGNMKESFSYDGGDTWTNATTSHIEHPNSAIYVGWTSSGKLLMINHKDFTGRNNLTAFLSEDGGKTWPHTLLLDARSGVSYPDVIEDNGTFYVVYDYDRFNTGQMYMAKITEADIIAGGLTTSGSYLKHRFSDMGIHGPQVSDEALKIDLSDADVSASTEGSPAQNAFDGNTDTRWCATSVDMPQWLMIDLKDVYNLESVYVFFEQKSDWNYKIETSVDGTTWDEYANPGSQRIIDVTITKDAAARYVRLTVNGTTDGAWASVWEMEIYGNKAQSSYSLRPSQPVADQTLSGNSLSENEKSDSQDTVSGNEIDDLPETVSGNHVGD